MVRLDEVANRDDRIRHGLPPAPTATATAAARSTAARPAAPAALRAHERVLLSALAWCRARFEAGGDVRHDLLAFLEVAFDDFGPRTIRDPITDANGLQLFISPRPHGAGAHRNDDGSKQRIDRRGAALDRRSGGREI